MGCSTVQPLIKDGDTFNLICTQQQLAPMWRWSRESRQEVGCQPWQLAHPTTPATTYTPMHPHTPPNTHPPVGHQLFPALQPTAPTAPPNTHHEEGPHTPTQQQTTPATTHTRAHLAWERGHNTRSKCTKERVGGLCCTRQRKDCARESPRREVVRSSAGAGVVYPPFLGVIRVAYPTA